VQLRRIHELKKSLPVLIAIAILAASCSDGSSATTTSAPATTTSRAAQPGSFVAERPDDQAVNFYLTYADSILPDTPWTQEAMGIEAWFRMLENGALRACQSYHEGGSTIDAIRMVIDVELPLQNQVPAPDDVDAYDLLSAVFIGGIDAYCPDLIETIYESLFLIGFDQAWEELTGGPAPFRPIRLPGG
jgi:hypothetical protein